MALTAAYVSIGANRSSSCAACTSAGILAYGAGNTVALWDTTDKRRGVYATLLGHRAAVTTVKVREEAGKSATIVSGDAAGEIRIWQQGVGRQFACVKSWSAHPGSVVSALGFVPGDDGDILTGGSDAVVRRWRISREKPEEVQKLDLKGRLPLDVDAALLPQSSEPLLIIGCTDRKVQVWTISDGQFKHALSLEGHEDWIRCVSLTAYPSSASSSSTNPDLLLATGAQDNYVRLWRITPSTGTLDVFEEFERRLGDGTAQLSTKAHILTTSSSSYSITLEALLVGHESGLTNVHWSPTSPPVLLSTAADNSMVIWSPTADAAAHNKDGMWIPEHRFGAIGGRGLAFFGAIWGPKGDQVLATGWTGAVERWVRSPDGEGWDAAPGVTGHYGGVQSVAWEPEGAYLLSTSSDQTSRIHAPCSGVWAEIARPQVHGYDLVDGGFLSPFRLASAADEKVLRVFEATEGFAESLRGLGVCEKRVDVGALPKGATVPPLGLSNRALGKPTTETEIKTSHAARDSVSAVLSTLPTEEELSTATLWPEIEKVYGHGYELATIAASHTGDLIATASRASSTEHAAVRITSTRTWAHTATLPGHSLSVTRIAFSPDDKLVLTVSRDRGWRLFGRGENDAFEPVAKEERAHARMVLDCAWSTDGEAFATASRDKTVKLWRRDGEAWVCASTHKLAEAATAVAFATSRLAVGTESGAVFVLSVNGGEMEVSSSVSAADRCAGAVERLAWSPDGRSLACASLDCSVRVFIAP